MFERAKKERPEGTNDLVPYWICEGPFHIDRYVPAYPMSGDVARYHDIKTALALYRLVLGQPRQQEMLEVLKSVAATDEDRARLQEQRIDLAPG
jgi:hypothetical protein